MTTIEALLDLYEALGGDADEISTLNTIPELLEEISEVAGSTIELPGVTASDNGDVLTVVDGKWAKKKIPEISEINLNVAGLNGIIKTLEFKNIASISEVLILTSSGTITSTSESLDFIVPVNLLYNSGKVTVPLYQNGVQVGYFTLTASKITIAVDEEVTADSRHPVYANLTVF